MQVDYDFILQLARYCDQLLKKGSKGVGDNELEEKLDNAVSINTG